MVLEAAIAASLRLCVPASLRLCVSELWRSRDSSCISKGVRKGVGRVGERMRVRGGEVATSKVLAYA